MKKLLFVLLLSAAAVAASAQALVRQNLCENLRRTLRDNSLSLRYGAQVGVGSGSEHVMQFVGLDYARYNFYNVGFRTGVNFFTSTALPGTLVSVPMQFSWRSGRRVNRNSAPDPHGYWYNGEFYPDADYGKMSTLLSNVLWSRLPSVVELHAGFTPGLCLGGRGQKGAGCYAVDQRFTCTADLGGRLMLPIRRVSLFVDVTYHYYLTRNWRDYVAHIEPHRSYVSLAGGLAVAF